MHRLLTTVWISDLSNQTKIDFFLAVAVSVLLYSFTTWTLTKRLKKRLEGNYTNILRKVLNSGKQHPIKQQLCGHLPPISQIIQARRTRLAGSCF